VDHASTSARRLVALPDRGVALEVVVTGDRPEVLLIPSAHRGGDDYAQLAADLWTAGFGSLAVNVRGVGASSATLAGLDLRDVAADLAALVATLDAGPVHVVGHALGQVFARCLATYHPGAVRTVTLLACGGHDRATRPPPVHLLDHFDRCSDVELATAERLVSLHALFFAKGNDPTPWLDGWWPHPDIAAVFGSVDPDEWATAGRAPVLILQPLADPLCLPEVGAELLARIGPRATLVELPDCSHAMLPEQPDRIASAIVDFVARNASRPRER
jgi:pimeloyl-ACP methyl ester carboxylesterase